MHAPVVRSEGVYRENGGVTWDVSTVDRPFRSDLVLAGAGSSEEESLMASAQMSFPVVAGGS